MNFRIQQITDMLNKLSEMKVDDVDAYDTLICEITAAVILLDPFLIGELATLEETEEHPLADKIDVSLILKELHDIKQLLTQSQQKHINIKRGFVVIVKDEKTQVLLLGPEMRNYDLNIPEDQMENESFIGQVVFDAVQKELVTLKESNPEFAEKVKDAQINIQIIPIPEVTNENQSIQDQPS